MENQDGNCVDAEDCDNFEDDLPDDCRSRAFSFNFIGREDDLSLPYHDCDDKGKDTILGLNLKSSTLKKFKTKTRGK